MKARHKYLLVCFVFHLFFTPLYAQDEPEQTDGQKDLGEWWLVSSLSIDSLPEQLLFHAEAEVSFTRMTGNLDANILSGSTTWALRKKTFTNSVIYSVDRQEISLGGNRGSVTTESQKVDYESRVDLTRRFHLSAGILWERDDPRFLKNRWTYYAGLGYHVANAKKHKLNLVVASGQQRDKYTMDDVKETLEVFYVYASHNWQIDDRLSFRQKLTSLMSFSDTEHYRLQLDLNLDVNITGTFSVPISFEAKFDNKPIQAAEKWDTQQTVGLKLSF